MTTLAFLFLAIYCQNNRPLCILFTLDKSAFYILLTFTLALISTPQQRNKHLMFYYLQKGLLLYSVLLHIYFSYLKHIQDTMVNFQWHDQQCSGQSHQTLPLFSFSFAAPHHLCFQN